MIKLDRFQIQADQITKDIQCLGIRSSGIPDSDENKLAAATMARAIAKNALSLSSLLNKEADKLYRVKEPTGQLQTACATTP